MPRRRGRGRDRSRRRAPGASPCGGTFPRDTGKIAEVCRAMTGAPRARARSMRPCASRRPMPRPRWAACTASRRRVAHSRGQGSRCPPLCAVGYRGWVVGAVQEAGADDGARLDRRRRCRSPPGASRLSATSCRYRSRAARCWGETGASRRGPYRLEGRHQEARDGVELAGARLADDDGHGHHPGERPACASGRSPRLAAARHEGGQGAGRAGQGANVDQPAVTEHRLSLDAGPERAAPQGRPQPHQGGGLRILALVEHPEQHPSARPKRAVGAGADEPG